MINIEFPNEIRDRILELETEVRNINTTDEIDLSEFINISKKRENLKGRIYSLYWVLEILNEED